MIQAYKKDHELIAELYARQPDQNQLYIWWLGQSGYLISWNGVQILLDPYLSDSLSQKYQDTDKPHVRMSELVVRPELLTNISLITSSHAHTDHLDPGTLAPLLKNNPQADLIIPEAHRKISSDRASCALAKPIGMDIGSKYQAGDLSIIAVPAAHESLEKDELGQALYLGYIISLGPWTLYHSGDTVLYPGMAEILQSYAIDISFLPINGADPARRVAGNLNAAEAVWLASQLHSSLTIPGHYHMFEFNSVEPDEFVSMAEKHAINYKVLAHGELLTLVK